MYMYNYHIKNYGLYHNATGTYKITMNILRKYYSCTTGKLQVCGIRVTMHHYGHYSHYKFRGKVPWFADVQLWLLE